MLKPRHRPEGAQTLLWRDPVGQQLLRKANLLAHRFFKRTAFSNLLARAVHRIILRGRVENRFTSLYQNDFRSCAFFYPCNYHPPATECPGGSVYHGRDGIKHNEMISSPAPWPGPIGSSCQRFPRRAKPTHS